MSSRKNMAHRKLLNRLSDIHVSTNPKISSNGFDKKVHKNAPEIPLEIPPEISPEIPPENPPENIQKAHRKNVINPKIPLSYANIVKTRSSEKSMMDNNKSNGSDDGNNSNNHPIPQNNIDSLNKRSIANCNDSTYGEPLIKTINTTQSINRPDIPTLFDQTLNSPKISHSMSNIQKSNNIGLTTLKYSTRAGGNINNTLNFPNTCYPAFMDNFMENDYVEDFVENPMKSGPHGGSNSGPHDSPNSGPHGGSNSGQNGGSNSGQNGGPHCGSNSSAEINHTKPFKYGNSQLYRKNTEQSKISPSLSRPLSAMSGEYSHSYSRLSKQSQSSDKSGKFESNYSRLSKPPADKSEKFLNNYTRLSNTICAIRDGVVAITGYHKLDSGEQCIRKGNGFFIKGYYIICPSNIMLYDPHVLMSRILITISNVNGSGISYIYQASVIGMDAVGNVGVLYIDHAVPWNSFNPQIMSTHPYLDWGSARSTYCGENIFLIGDIIKHHQTYHNNSSNIFNNTSMTSNIPMIDTENGIILSNICNNTSMTSNIPMIGTENGIILTNISDNRYVSYNGQIQGELILLSYNHHSVYMNGLPVINYSGKVIGMQIYSQHDHLVAISEFFMRRPVKAIISTKLLNIQLNDMSSSVSNMHHSYCVEGDNNTSSSDNNTSSSDNTSNNINSISNNNSGSNTGMSYDAIGIEQINNIQDINTPSGDNIVKVDGIRLDILYVGFISQCVYDNNIIYKYNKSFLGIEGTLSTQDDYLGVVNIACSRKVIGYKITKIINNNHPLNIGDIITHIGQYPLGDRKWQKSPALIMWRIKPHTEVKLKYKKISEDYTNKHKIKLTTMEYPVMYDFPWYSVDSIYESCSFIL